MIHELKLYLDFFEEVISGEKSFEIRKNDRQFRVGDMLALNEYDGNRYTGRSCLVYVDYIMNSPEYVKEGMVVMSIKPCTVYRHTEPFNPIKLAKDYSVSLATDRYSKERCYVQEKTRNTHSI